jgi:hypothetical protein
MEFMMLVGTDPNGEPFDANEPIESAWERQATRAGFRIGGRHLATTDATVVRVREGEVLVGGEPALDEPARLTALEFLEVSSLDEAIDVAAAHPMARFGRIELRRGSVA